MKKVLCFGELLLRLSPELNGEWIRQSTMPVFVGGAELNVARALAQWQVPVTYCTALPDNYLTGEILSSLQQKGVDTENTILTGNRIGSYYLAQGADLKHSGVIYDRAFSSFWDLQPGELRWEEILNGVEWLHVSAITPALNANLAAICLEAVRTAHHMGLTVSIDLNYRSKLWQYGKLPLEVMPELVQYCQVIMGNIWAAEKMLGIPVDTMASPEKEDFIGQALKISEAICTRFSHCRQVANTFRFDLNNGVDYFATLFAENRILASQCYHSTQIIDKVGTGDAFMAGLIYGNYQSFPLQEVIDFATAAAYNKLFVKGDASTASVEEIKKIYQHA